eukprot:COSAG04_NODE_647_length_11596_cov_18.199878_7_plen_41_part_00
MGLTQDELGQMIDSFGIKCGAEKLRTLFRQVRFNSISIPF